MLLLDTHAYYWFITDSDRLPIATKEMIETEEHVFVSIASFWAWAKHFLSQEDPRPSYIQSIC